MTTLSTSWQTVSSGDFSFTYVYNYNMTFSLQAYYEKVNNTTARIHLRGYIYNNSGYGWSGSNKNYGLAGNGNDFGTVQDTAGLDAYSGHYLNEYTYDVSAGSTTTASGWYNIPVGSGTEISASLSVPTFVVAPNKPTISVENSSYQSNKITYGTTSFGNPSSGTVKLYGDTTSAPTTQISSHTYTGNGTYTHSSLTGNKRYYYRAQASNSSVSSEYSATISVYTPCPPLSALSLSSQSYSAYNKVSAVLSYTRQADGGAQTRTGYYRYSTDGGTTYTAWTSFGTVSETTGTFTIANLPTSASVRVQAKIKTSSGGDSTSKTFTFSTSTTHTAPNFANFTYADTVSAVTTLTGSNQVLIQGQSQPQITISAANKATANDGATITGYTASFNASSIQIAYSSTDTVTGTFTAKTPTISGTLVLKVAANDSLALSKSVSKNVTVLPWAAPTITASVKRTNNFESETTLAINGTYSPITVSGTAKNTLAVAYRYKKASATTWSSWYTRPTTISGSNYSTTNLVLSLDNNYQWDVQVRAIDKFTTTTVSMVLSVGIPLFFIGSDGRLAIGGKPTKSLASGEIGLLEVNGPIYSNGNKVLTEGKIRYGASAPADTVGNNGDLFIVY